MPALKRNQPYVVDMRSIRSADLSRYADGDTYWGEVPPSADVAALPMNDTSSGVDLVQWIREHIGTANTMLGPYLGYQIAMSELAATVGAKDGDRIDLFVGVSTPFWSFLGGSVDVVGGYYPNGESLFNGSISYGKVSRFSVVVDTSQTLLVALSDASLSIHVEAAATGAFVSGAAPFSMGTAGSGGDTSNIKDNIPKIIPDPNKIIHDAMWVIAFLLLAFYLLHQVQKGALKRAVK
jgi:hypothetical protein